MQFDWVIKKQYS